jgi:ABC-type glycerol-3-phosphate transport system substrate-binding protein
MKMRRWNVFLVLVLALAAAGIAGCGGGEADPTPQGTPELALEQIQLNPHPASLEGKTVVLRWNGKPNGDKFLSRVAELLNEQIPSAKVIKLWETNPETAISSENAEVSTKIAETIAALAPDLVIASQCD